VSKKLYEGTADGYIPSVGTMAARKAIAVYSGRKGKTEYTEDDICIASGCSGALDLVITALVDEGDNILVPQPGFPLYQVIAESLGGNTKNYALLPHKGWECDLQDMEAQIDENTKAILVNNPSNPTGSNYSEAHLKAICKVRTILTAPINKGSVVVPQCTPSRIDTCTAPFIVFVTCPPPFPYVLVGPSDDHISTSNFYRQFPAITPAIKRDIHIARRSCTT
jgi:hypothetical protein